MRVLDGAVAVFCGVAGVQPQSETVWRQATKYNVPRIAFVNKMDRTGANFENALDDMRKKLSAYAYAIFLPIGAEENFEGVIDVVNQKAITWGKGEVVSEGLSYVVMEIPEELKEKAAQALRELDRRGFGQGRRDCAPGHRRQADCPAGPQSGHPPVDLQDRIDSGPVRIGLQKERRANAH